METFLAVSPIHLIVAKPAGWYMKGRLRQGFSVLTLHTKHNKLLLNKYTDGISRGLRATNSSAIPYK